MIGLARLRLFFSIILPGLTGILILSVLHLQHSHLQQIKHGKSNIPEVNRDGEKASEKRLAMLAITPKVGYGNLLADWMFLDFLQYFGNFEERQRTGYSLSKNYFQNIVDNDPYFIESYVFLVNSVSMYSGQPRETVKLLEQGLEHMLPDTPKRSYLIWRHKGTDELLFIGDSKAAQQSYKTAAIWAEQSSDEDASLVAKRSHKTADFLSTSPNSTSAQIGAWSDVLLRATDNNIRQKAIEEIEALGGRVLLAENGQVTVRYKSDVE